ncbi:MAG TPA: outer membrane protein assembly factor BamE [Usitatibacter sp.]|nr:outer membrane protein assembly factor BamE [Usitatibacter sp.]
MFTRPLILAVTCALLAACGPFVYKIDVQQGNYVTQDVVARLKVGMTKAETRQLLGTPLLNDVFHADRWDYYYSSVKGGKADERKRFTVLFKDDKVASFEGQFQPAAPAPVGTPPPPGTLPPPRTAPPPAPDKPTPAPAPSRSGSPLPSERTR